MSILLALLIFSVLVVVHEFGHFILAKKHGVGVPEFSVGMGPRLITVAKTSKGWIVKFLCSQKVYENTTEWEDVTKYSWKLLPLGGSCAMVGEDEDDESEESFNAKGKWARFSILFAGPLFNVILALILSFVFVAYSGIDYATVNYAYEGQPAYEAGIRKGDLIKSIDGDGISIGREISTHFILHPMTDEDIEIVIERDGKEKTITLNPAYKTHIFGFNYTADKTSDTKIASVGKDTPFSEAGIKAGDKIRSVNGTKVTNGAELNKVIDKNNVGGKSVHFEIERDGEVREYDITPEPYETKLLGIYLDEAKKPKNAWDVIKYSFVEVKYQIETTVASVGKLITGKISPKALSGPVGIVDTMGTVIDQGKEYGMSTAIMNLLYISILLSANLGVMNLLPIPALDGGRILFVLVEAVRGKPLDKNKEGYVHFAGFVLLIALMVFVMYNDIIRIIG